MLRFQGVDVVFIASYSVQTLNLHSKMFSYLVIHKQNQTTQLDINKRLNCLIRD